MKKPNFIYNVFRIITIIVSIYALLPNPYGYYMLLKIFITIISAYSCYKAIQQKNESWAWIFGTIAILFNPIFKVHLTRGIWSAINIIVVLIYLVSIFKFKLPDSKNKEQINEKNN